MGLVLALGGCVEDEGSDLVLNGDFYGPLTDERDRVTCLAGEYVAVLYPDTPQFAVCSATCNDVADCPAPPLGASTPLECVADSAGIYQSCVMVCSIDADCPSGMTCTGADICMWAFPEIPGGANGPV